MGLCERFHCLPSALLEEDAEVLRLVAIVERGRPPQDPAGADVGGMPGGDW